MTYSDWWVSPRSVRIEDCRFLDPSFKGKSAQIGIKSRLTDARGIKIIPTPEIVVAITDGDTTLEYGFPPDLFSDLYKFVFALQKEPA